MDIELLNRHFAGIGARARLAPRSQDLGSTRLASRVDEHRTSGAGPE